MKTRIKFRQYGLIFLILIIFSKLIAYRQEDLKPEQFDGFNKELFSFIMADICQGLLRLLYFRLKWSF